MRKQPGSTTLTACAFAALLALAGCSIPATQVETASDLNAPVIFEPIYVEGLTPAKTIGSDLIPGLVPVYYQNFFQRDLTGLPKGKHPEYPSTPGKPILQIDHQFNRNNVFDSGTNRGIGIRMNGYINFAETGVYEMQALSNDGVFLYLSDQLVLADPKQHSDRLSNLAFVTIDTPGWYPVTLEYFQRKGTAALKLLWKTPTGKGQVPLPAEAYAHQ